MRIAFLSAEVSPFAKTGGLGDVAGALPKALHDLGHDVVVITPLYRQTSNYFDRSGETLERVASLPVRTPAASGEAVIFKGVLPKSAVPVYFVEFDLFFNREQLYSNDASGFDDQLERFVFFCRAAVEVCRWLKLPIDVMHCNDWHTALLPVLLRGELREDPLFENCRSVYTIHNLNYQGRYGGNRFTSLGISSYFGSPRALEYYGDVNLMKGGIVFADAINTVSHTYASEMQRPEFGAGLDGLLRENSWKLRGVLNGIDVEEWDPANDVYLDAAYSAGAMSGKAKCRRALRKEVGLRYRPGSPIAGMVSRLVEQKGIDILLPAIEKLLALGVQIVILGTGERQYEDALVNCQKNFPDDFRFIRDFNVGLSHRITAGTDLLFMPSRYEPCGLNQMYALRYGTIPIVRLTGGLADTVIPFDGTNLATANGFGFHSTSSFDLYQQTLLATLLMRQPKSWAALQKNGMKRDDSWEASARAYEQMYRKD